MDQNLKSNNPGTFRKQLTAIILCGVLFILGSCSETHPNHKELLLSPKYRQIQTIVSIADCSSPSGNYTTEIHSEMNGSCFFVQRSEDWESPFIAKIDTENKGYVFDEKEIVQQTLSEDEEEMIKGHEIHKMISRPDLFFKNIHFANDTTYLGQKHERHQGIDKLGHPVSLFYNRRTKRISKLEFLNSLDTTQMIEIINSDWIKTAQGQMPQRADIVQARKDTFRFIFRKIEINK